MNIYRHIPTLRTLEQQYSPSTLVPDIERYKVQYRGRSESARLNRSTWTTLRYGPAEPEVLDFFSAEAAQRLPPLLIYLHGGYWQELSKNEHSFPAVACRRHGVSYAAVGYGLAPGSSLDEIVERCRRAITWLAGRSIELGFDRNAMHIGGSSAGAHLAAMVGLTPWSRYGLPGNPVRSLVLLSGIFDLRPLILTYINNAVRLDEGAALRNSPLLLLDCAVDSFPPTLIAYGDNETDEFKRQSREFSEAIIRKGSHAWHYEIPGRNHFDLPFDLADADTMLGRLMLTCMGVRLG